jgi:hypothetical protein
LAIALSLQKSLISKTGAAEVKNLTNFCVSSSLPQSAPSAMRIPVPRFSIFCRLVGMAFKSLSRTTSKIVRRLKIVYTKGHLPLDLWLGSGSPLDPYVVGQIHSYLREKMVPRQLTEPPFELEEELARCFRGLCLGGGWLTGWSTRNGMRSSGHHRLEGYL